MACVVNKITLANGESSNLFEMLSSVNSPSLALENYLELSNNKEKYIKIYGENKQGEVDAKRFMASPKYKLVEFDSYQQQLDVIDTFTDMVLGELKGMEKTGSRTTLSKINLDGLTGNPMVIKTVVRNIQKKISAEINANNYPPKMTALLKEGAEKLGAYLGEAGVLGPIGAKLALYGINIKVEDSKSAMEQIEDYNEGVNPNKDYEDAQTEYERIYDMSILEASPANSVLPQLRIFLRGIKKVDRKFKFNRKEPFAVQYEVSETGDNRPARYDVMLSSLYATLAGTQSVGEVKVKLEESLDTYPQLVPIYQALISEESINIDKVGEYNKLSTALFSLAKQDYNMASFVEMVNGEVVLMSSNSETASKSKQSQWSNNARDIRSSEPNTSAIESVKSFLNSKATTRGLNARDAKTGLYASSGSNLGTAANLLRKAGFDGVTKEVLRTLIDRVQKNPLLIHKSNSVLTPSSTVKAIVKALAQKTLEGVDVFPQGVEIGEAKSLRLLSEIVAETSAEPNIGAFLGGAGTLMHPLNFGSEAQDIFSKIQGNSEENRAYFQTFVDNPMYLDTKIVSLLTDLDGQDASVFESNTLDTLKNNKAQTGVSYGALSTFDALASRMNAFFAPKGNNRYAQIFGPTQGDRGNLELVTLPKFNMKEGATQHEIAGAIFDSAGRIQSKEVKMWVGNQVHAELRRILDAQGHASIPNYGENGVRFNLFTDLNAVLNVKKLNEKNLEKITKDLLPMAEQQLFNTINDDMQFYVDNGVLDKKGVNFTTNIDSASVLSKKVGAQVGGKLGARAISKAEMETFLANNFIYNYELMLFRVGDPAFYKAASDIVQKVDINKRFSLPFTPGVKLAVGAGTGMPQKTFKTIILKEGKFTSEVADVMKAVTGVEVGVNTDLADGQGWSSIDRFRRTLLAQGLHTDGILDLLTAHEKWRPGDKVPYSESDTIKVMKPFLFTIQNIGEVHGPFSLKYGLFPALPAFFEATEMVNGVEVAKYPSMSKLSKYLNSGKADEAVMESAVKVGKRNVIDISEVDNAVPVELNNESVRHPQITPSKIKTEELYGSQMRKLIISNFDPTGILKQVHPITGEVSFIDSAIALQHYNAAIKNLVTEGGDGVYDTFIDGDGTGNIPALIEELINGASAATNIEYLKAAVLTIENDGESTLPLYYPTMKTKMDNRVNAKFRKAVNRPKLPGHSAVQVSSYGMESAKQDGTLGVGSDLKFVTFANPDGTRLSNAKAIELAKLVGKEDQASKDKLLKYIASPAEIRVTPNFFIGTLRKISKDKAKGDKSLNAIARDFAEGFKANDATTDRLFRSKKATLIEEKAQAEFIRLKSKITNSDGSFKLEEIQRAGLDEVVIYRIPTQGKNSMLMGKIKEFLPPTSGNTIQVPSEIVDQAGSDFDIDKVYIEMSSFEESFDRGATFQKVNYIDKYGNVDISSKAKAQSYIIDFHKGILSSPLHIKELLSPNGTTKLEQIVKNPNLLADEGSMSGNIASVKLQETFRDNNKSGKELISISSVSSVMHSVAQQVDLQFIEDVNLLGSYEKVQPMHFGDKMNIVGETLISEEISEIQNAALDNANKPLLGLLNIDSFTASTALMLISAGHGLEFAVNVLNAPIVKELAKVYPKYSRLFSPTTASKKAYAEIRRRYKLSPRAGFKQFSLDTFSAKKAEKLLKPVEGSSDNAISLLAFQVLQERADQHSKAQRTMNIDSKGVPSSVAKLFDAYQSMSEIEGTHSESTAVVELSGYHRKAKKPNFKVDPVKWRESHLAAMERYTLSVPLAVNKIITPSASKQMQYVLSTAKDLIGFMPEGTQLNVLSSYDTYLAQNRNAHINSSTALAHNIEKGNYLYLTDVTNPKSAANLLKNYRAFVSKTTKAENQFTSLLNIVEKEGQHYVTFNALTEGAMSGEEKGHMIFFFEELMNSKEPIEQELSEALSQYAMVHYGYANSRNSFMNFIPPSAHREFMVKDNNGVGLPEFFRSIEGTYNDRANFGSEAESFVEMYIQNNAHKLSLDTYFESDPMVPYEVPRNGNLHWKDQIQEMIDQDEKYDPPKYIKVFNPTGDFYLYIKEDGEYRKLERRGVPNLAFEYHVGKSHFNSTPSKVEMDATAMKNLASVANKTAMKNINKDSRSYGDIETVVRLEEQIDIADVKSEEAAVLFAKAISQAFVKETNMGDAQAELINSAINVMGVSARMIFDFKKKKGKLKPGETFNTIFVETYQQGAISILNEAYMDMKNKFC